MFLSSACPVRLALVMIMAPGVDPRPRDATVHRRNRIACQALVKPHHLGIRLLRLDLYYLVRVPRDGQIDALPGLVKLPDPDGIGNIGAHRHQDIHSGLYAAQQGFRGHRCAVASLERQPQRFDALPWRGSTWLPEAGHVRIHGSDREAEHDLRLIFSQIGDDTADAVEAGLADDEKPITRSQDELRHSGYS